MTPTNLKLFPPKPDHSTWKHFALSLITQDSFLKANAAFRLLEVITLTPEMHARVNSTFLRAMKALHANRVEEIQA